ncbi:serine/threonine-protein kinase [Siculibacillus lacustris]|uniref:serine/threonine-protein kinase n=1 Tax=Siculibacillus lacustris TaxID=1549641 RepID=UPI0019CFFDEC|nr:serine/threonine-protein kinase [Siculibacillus lacustris]
MSNEPGTAGGGRGWLPAGTRLNDMYELQQGIAAGGMGEIYRGHNIQTGDEVAIKMIRSDVTETETAMTMFRKEASALNKLYNEAIVRYYGFSVDPTLKRPYMAMEFVSGRSLSDTLKEHPLSFDEVRVLGARVAGGLQVAHERGIIHRDISPDNIIIPEADVAQAKIIDFGIARQTKSSEGTIIGDGFAGKYNYVSPEQLGLCGGDVTGASDIYSLGLVLAEAVTGRAINMRGNPVEVIEKRRKVPDLSHVDPRLQPLIAWMLAPEPQDRPGSMAEVAAWLKRAATHAPPGFQGGDLPEGTVAVPGAQRWQTGGPGGSARPGSQPPSQPPREAPSGWGAEPSRRPSAPPGWEPAPSSRPSAPPGWDAAPASNRPTGPSAWDAQSARSAAPGREPSQRSAPPGWEPQRSAPPPEAAPSRWPSAPPADHRSRGPIDEDPATVVARAGTGAALRSVPPAAAPEPRAPSRAPTPPAARDEPPKRSALPLVAAIVGVVALAGGGGAFFLMSGSKTETPTAVVTPDKKPTQPVAEQKPAQPSTRPTTTAATTPDAGDEAAAAQRRTVRAADLAAYLQSYAGGDCFFVAPVAVTEGRVVTEGYGRSIAPFEALDDDFRAKHGFEPDIRLRQVTEAQCPALDLLAKARADAATRPRIEVAAARVKAGETMAGQASAPAGDYVSVVLVRDDGTIRLVTPATRSDKPSVSFTLAAERGGEGGGKPGLLVAISSSTALASLSVLPTEPAAGFVDRLSKDAARTGARLAAAAQYVVVER